jgi:hypothetical protein
LTIRRRARSNDRKVTLSNNVGFLALSNVYAGLANGFQQTQNIDPTVGVRIKF